MSQNNTENIVRRTRNESIKQFTKRFRSFSIDLMRSIELAHDMVDLRNSNFVSATQSAAAQQYNSERSAERNAEYDPEYGAEVSDDNNAYLSPYYRMRSDTKKSNNVTDQLNTTEIRISRLVVPNNQPSTSTSFNNPTEIENNIQKDNPR